MNSTTRSKPATKPATAATPKQTTASKQPSQSKQSKPAASKNATAAPLERRPRGSASRVSSTRQASFTVPTLSLGDGADVAERLQERLISLLDLSLTLKHIHWNVVGPHFIAVHEMLDPQYHAATAMIDELAERIATLGGVPSTLPRRSDDVREWNDYSLDRADSLAHLGALDMVFVGVVTGHRDAVDLVGEIDLISQDLLVGQTRQLERFHWFVRSHLADWAGGMANAGSTTELGAARSVAAKSRRQRKA